MASALLCPASTIATGLPERRAPAALSVLPIDEAPMPAEDVSDLRDVVDAINRLCETMKTSTYDEPAEDEDEPEPAEVAALTPERAAADVPRYTEYAPDLISPGEVTVRRVEAFCAERWSESQTSLPQADELEAASDAAQYEPASEMYYTASSEVSLLSDLEPPERALANESPESEDAKDDRKECVIAGHVAAMRERFESMTRANTPCPDLARSVSPSLDLFRNVTPSPDHLG